MHEAGQSLSTVRLLAFSFTNKGGVAATAAALEEAMLHVARACPALTSVSSNYHPLPQRVLCGTEEVCPLLHEFSSTCPYITNLRSGATYWRHLQLLPSCISILVLFELDEVLPDLSKNTSIRFLEVSGFKFEYESQWLLLPSKLEHLRCDMSNAGPPACKEGGHKLSNLSSVAVSKSTYDYAISLGVFAQLLRAAPVLKVFRTGWEPITLGSAPQHDVFLEALKQGDSCTELLIEAPFSMSSACDLSLLQQRIASGLSLNATYRIGHGEDGPAESSDPPLTAAQDCTAQLTSCVFERLEAGELGPLLCLLPNLRHLGVNYPELMEDSDLQELWQCPKLTTLKVYMCEQVTAMGVYALCQRLPGLAAVKILCCDQITELAFTKYRDLLARQGMQVETGIDIW